MPSEGELRKFITAKLGLEGYVCWWSPRVAYRKQQDIFSIYDGICAKGDKLRLIQFTTKSNKSSHLVKMNDFRTLYNLTHPGELWLWDGKKNEFEIINL